MRKQGKELALAKRFQEAREVKERADQLQQKLSMRSLLDRQRDEVTVFEGHFQMGIEFIEKEHQKAKEKFVRVMERMAGGQKKRNVVKVWKQPTQTDQRKLVWTRETTAPPRGRWI
jgi:hypothetical protein